MSGAIHPLPQYAFMAWCLVKKHRENFLLLLTWNTVTVFFGGGGEYVPIFRYKGFKIRIKIPASESHTGT
jgi:hypothetical protein